MAGQSNYVPNPEAELAATRLAFVLMAATDVSRVAENVMDILEQNLNEVSPALLEKLDKPIQALNDALKKVHSSMARLWV